MSCFGDIRKLYIPLDNTLNSTVGRISECDDGSILISESIHLVAYYEKQTFNPIRSWSFPHLKSLSCPAIHNSLTGEIVAVQEKKILTIWDVKEDKKRIMKCTFDLFEKGIKIACVLSVSGTQPIVIFTNGSCQPLAKAIEKKNEMNDKVIEDNEEVVHVGGFLSIIKYKNHPTKKRITLLIATKDKETICQDESTCIEKIYKIVMTRKTTGRIYQITHQTLKNPYDIWHWSKDLESFIAVENKRGHLNVVVLNGKDEKSLQTLEGSHIKNLFGISMANKEDICLIGKTNDIAETYLLELWKMKYGIKMGEIQLPYKPLYNDCKVIGNEIFISCANGIISISLAKQSISLASVLDKGMEDDCVKMLGDDCELTQLERLCDKIDSIVDITSTSSIETIQNFHGLILSITDEVPESLLARLFKTCLNQLKNEKSFDSKFMKAFERVLCIPYNDISLIECLRDLKLTNEDILNGLEHLLSYLPTTNVCIIDWINTMTDAFMNHLIAASRNQEETLEAIHKMIEKIDHFRIYYERLNDINIDVDLILGRTQIRLNQEVARKKVQDYCIEIITF